MRCITPFNISDKSLYILYLLMEPPKSTDAKSHSAAKPTTTPYQMINSSNYREILKRKTEPKKPKQIIKLPVAKKAPTLYEIHEQFYSIPHLETKQSNAVLYKANANANVLPLVIDYINKIGKARADEKVDSVNEMSAFDNKMNNEITDHMLSLIISNEKNIIEIEKLREERDYYKAKCERTNSLLQQLNRTNNRQLEYYQNRIREMEALDQEDLYGKNRIINKLKTENYVLSNRSTDTSKIEIKNDEISMRSEAQEYSTIKVLEDDTKSTSDKKATPTNKLKTVIELMGNTILNYCTMQDQIAIAYSSKKLNAYFNGIWKHICTGAIKRKQEDIAKLKEDLKIIKNNEIRYKYLTDGPDTGKIGQLTQKYSGTERVGEAISKKFSDCIQFMKAIIDTKAAQKKIFTSKDIKPDSLYKQIIADTPVDTENLRNLMLANYKKLNQVDVHKFMEVVVDWLAWCYVSCRELFKEAKELEFMKDYFLDKLENMKAQVDTYKRTHDDISAHYGMLLSTNEALRNQVFQLEKQAFSYNSQIATLSTKLKNSSDECADLKKDIAKMKQDLEVAKKSQKEKFNELRDKAKEYKRKSELFAKAYQELTRYIGTVLS